MNRMTNILVHPKEEWRAVRKEPTTYGDLLVQYVAPLEKLEPKKQS
jgi:hypothetical protein